MRVSENSAKPTADSLAPVLSVKEKLCVEQRELLVKLDALRKMLLSPKPEISKKQLSLMKKQEKAMSLYNKLLFSRIQNML